ncbi:MAG: response regulator [Bacteroidota bacterium]
MSKTRILVVEDESIVAKDIQRTLEKLGYDVPGTASSAAAAYEKLEELEPDLVFLDVKLKGEQDGVHIAEHIKDRYDIPVIFLTSFIDQETIDRAKVTEPYGYLVKPFNEGDLKTTVEMALFKFAKDREVRMSEQRLSNALGKIENAVFVTDQDLRLNYINEKALTICGGLSGMDSIGLDVFSLIGIEKEGGVNISKEDLKNNVIRDNIYTLSNAYVIIKKDNSNIPCNFTASAVRDEKDNFLGIAIVVTDANEAAAVAPNQVVPSTIMDNQVVQNSFFVKKGSMLVKVYLDNVQWIQAMDNYVIIQTNTDQFIIHSTMKDVEMKLPSAKFLRVHRSYIIPLEKITVLDENSVLIGDKTIPIGKSYKEVFMSRLNFL